MHTEHPANGRIAATQYIATTCGGTTPAHFVSFEDSGTEEANGGSRDNDENDGHENDDDGTSEQYVSIVGSDSDADGGHAEVLGVGVEAGDVEVASENEPLAELWDSSSDSEYAPSPLVDEVHCGLAGIHDDDDGSGDVVIASSSSNSVA